MQNRNFLQFGTILAVTHVVCHVIAYAHGQAHTYQMQAANPIPDKKRDVNDVVRLHADVEPAITENHGVENVTTTLPECDFYVKNLSREYFDSRLELLDPHFVSFALTFDVDKNISNTSTPAVFNSNQWVWTFSTTKGDFPYLSWNADYGILSFRLLDYKSIAVKYVVLTTNQSACTTHVGSEKSTWKIVDALAALVNRSTNSAYHKYENNYFCYLSIDTEMNETLEYTLSLYFNYPINYISYKCCRLSYFYTNSSYGQECFQQPAPKWSQCIAIPYVIGIIIFLYFPITLFELSVYASKKEKLRTHSLGDLSTNSRYSSVSSDTSAVDDDDNWVYLDGKPPLSVLDCFSCLSDVLNKRHPVLVSRIRRLGFVLLGPVVVYLQLFMYKDGMGVPEGHKIMVADLVRVGTPMGFLSLLADSKDSMMYFARIFGGPMCVLISYYVLGVVGIVLPRSLKQIVENGIPNERHYSVGVDNEPSLPSSPLFFSAKHIFRMAMLEGSPEPGYKKAALVFKCSFYMLFCTRYWQALWLIQSKRFRNVADPDSGRYGAVRYAAFPLLFLFCLIELLLCLILYTIPFVMFMCIMVKGATVVLLNLRARRPNICCSNPFTITLGAILILGPFLFFSYAFCLIFIESFTFIAQVIMFCFVAVILYPSISFGYLFFFVVLLYYLARLVRDFGDGYLGLLSTAVDKSTDLELQVNYVTFYEGQLVVSNVKATAIKHVRINQTLLDVPLDTLQEISARGTQSQPRMIRKGNMDGIPTDLFNYLVRKYRPLHIQFLKLIFQLLLIIVLIIMTMSITSKFESGPTSEMSDVMHVIFLVTVGALPRVLEVAMVNESEVVCKEIQDRNIEQSIMEYWREQEEERDYVMESWNT